ICPANECILKPEEYEIAAKKFIEAINEEAVFDDEITLTQQDILSQDEFGTLANLERVKGTLLGEAERLKSGYPPEHSQTWLHLLYNEWTWIGDYLSNPIIVLDNPAQLQAKQDSTQKVYLNNFNDALINGLVFNKQKDLVIDYDNFYNILFNSKSTKLLLSDLQRGLGKFKSDSLIKFESIGIANYQSQIKLLIKDLINYKQNNYTILLFAGSNTRANRLNKTLAEFNLSSKHFDNEIIENEINILPISINTGFVWPNNNLLFIADGDVYGSSYKKVKKKIEHSEKIASYTELFIGDYVVHETYGVGVYKGIKAISRNDSTQEYLIIEYAGSDILYVPTDQFDRVQKFASSESVKPSINKLGGTEWQNKKNKVKAGLKKLAFDLLSLYAERQKNTGFAYSKDTPWQREFEDDFPYELTPDQENSLKDIYSDMESNRNMDRLLCGDVGYGKTEVALRAAFKAITDNKQVAFLAPTTILVQQHYQTMLKRFANFPVNCDSISRFKTRKEQKQSLENLAEGKTDIIVGTHMLLAKDVQFKNLGLLIVDEEQRFGVSHKELIKNLKKNIDVLTLTATPIPRTLYMSMIGIRDMSILEMPPEDRLTVKTYVLEYNNTLIKDAIMRELNRGGQIYFVYNKVSKIHEMYEKLKYLVPEARICVAHGQMRETLLENTMMDFYSGAYDILLCTTIIENGLDIPEANTIIVYDADKFGLSQLYQLRGRVGRSSRQAYAYFTIRPDYMLSEVAQKRLMAIREFTEFGAGYRIALRDLEIRGAGNIFGPEQSGHLATVGFDMYLKMVEQALNEAQGKPSAPDD
ncbi:MAG: transcription-repair coupling factor, partial [Christensenellaceae bacterium]|nr:transcription-repair coupling factor [Christensenellaceae bacterium]